MSAKGSGPYSVQMADTPLHRLTTGPAVPLSITIGRDGGAWHIQAWYHGRTIHEALHPVLVGERWLDPGKVPAGASWQLLYHHAAIALHDLADGRALVGETTP